MTYTCSSYSLRCISLDKALRVVSCSFWPLMLVNHQLIQKISQDFVPVQDDIRGNFLECENLGETEATEHVNQMKEVNTVKLT